jgi:hypothetical protein
MAQSNATLAAIDRAYRFASKVPAFEISSSDPADSATGVAETNANTRTKAKTKGASSRLERQFELKELPLLIRASRTQRI